MSNVMTDTIQDRIRTLVELHLDGNWAELARKAKLKPSTLQQIKDGSEPRAGTLFKISRALGASVDWLISGESSTESVGMPGKQKSTDSHEVQIERAIQRALSGPEFIDLNEKLHADVQQQLAQHFGSEYDRLSRDDRIYYTITLYKHLYWMGLDHIDQKQVADVEGLIRLLKWAKNRPIPGHLKRKIKRQ